MLGMSWHAVSLAGLPSGVVLVGLTLCVVGRHPGRDSGRPANQRASARSLAAVAARYFRLAAAVHRLSRPILGRRHSAAAAGRVPVRSFRGGSGAAPGSSGAADALPSLTAVAVERGLRAALLIGGAYLIAWLLGLDVAAMTMHRPERSSQE
jgi:hypothetical protein